MSQPPTWLFLTEKYEHHFEFYHSEIGGAAFEKYGKYFPDEIKKICGQVDLILLGSVGAYSINKVFL